jgi:hypothetical protein
MPQMPTPRVTSVKIPYSVASVPAEQTRKAIHHVRPAERMSGAQTRRVIAASSIERGRTGSLSSAGARASAETTVTFSTPIRSRRFARDRSFSA